MWAIFFLIVPPLLKNGYRSADQQGEYVGEVVLLYCLSGTLQSPLLSGRLDTFTRIKGLGELLAFLMAIIGMWYLIKGCYLIEDKSHPKWIDFATILNLLMQIGLAVSQFGSIYWPISPRTAFFSWLALANTIPLLTFARIFRQAQSLIWRWRLFSCFLASLLGMFWLLIKLVESLRFQQPGELQLYSDLFVCLMSLAVCIGFLPNRFYVQLESYYQWFQNLSALISLRLLRTGLQITPLFDQPCSLSSYLTDTGYHLRRECICILDTYKLLDSDSLTASQKPIYQAISSLPVDLEYEELVDEYRIISWNVLRHRTRQYFF